MCGVKLAVFEGEFADDRKIVCLVQAEIMGGSVSVGFGRSIGIESSVPFDGFAPS
jgi:hypothetical protein